MESYYAEMSGMPKQSLRVFEQESRVGFRLPDTLQALWPAKAAEQTVRIAIRAPQRTTLAGRWPSANQATRRADCGCGTSARR